MTIKERITAITDTNRTGVGEFLAAVSIGLLIAGAALGQPHA